MRIFKTILLCFCLACAGTVEADAQIISKIFKRAGKKTVKEAAAIQTKEMAEDIATKAIVKEFGRTAVERSARKVVSEGSSEAAGRIVREAMDNGVRRATRVGLRHSVDDVALNVGRTVGKRYVKDVSGAVSSREVWNMAQEHIETGFRRVFRKRVVKESTEEALRKQVAEVLGERAAKEWYGKIAKEGVERKTQQLLADMAINKKLRNAIKKNPGLLAAYYRAIGSKLIRNDLSMLRYLDNGAGRFYKKGIKSINKYGDGSNLAFREINGVTEVVNMKTGGMLGTIEVDDAGKYIIMVPESGDRTLLNLYPKSNSTYVCGNNRWITDEKGRVIEVRYRAQAVGNTRNVRAKGMDTEMGTYKNMYNTEGRMVGDAPSRMPNDDGGHLIALENGGTSDFINYIPQDMACNRKGLWREAEKAASKAVREGETVECVINIYYPNKTTLRPSAMSRTHLVNGEYQRICNSQDLF